MLGAANDARKENAIKRRLGVRGKLMLAVGVVLSGTLIAAGIALTGYGNVRITFDAVVGHALPAMKEGMNVALQAERLVALAPVLSAAEDAQTRDEISTRIRTAMEDFSAHLDRLRLTGGRGEQLGDVETASTALLGNLADLDAVTAERNTLISRRSALLPRIMEAEARIQQFVTPWMSVLSRQDSLAREVLSDPSATVDAIREAIASLADATAMIEPIRVITVETGNARDLLLQAGAAADENRIAIAEARLPLALSAIAGALERLPEPLAGSIASQTDVLQAVGTGDAGLLKTRRQELIVQERVRGLLDGNHELARRMTGGIVHMIQDREQGISSATVDTMHMLDVSKVTQVAVAAASVLASFLVVWLYVGRNLVVRMMRLKESMRRIAEGDLEAEIALQGHDEITEMAAALCVFRDTAREVEAARAQTEAAQEQAATDRRRAVLTIADQFQSGIKIVVDTVSAAASCLHQTACCMADTAEDASQQASSVATAAAQASGNVDGAAAAADQLATSIAEVSRQAAESALITAQATEEAERTDTIMSSLSDAACRIGEVSNLITDIARQTNLLALNAAIEAARAGEAGRGFAVVAQEVKLLANQTATATDQIAAQISAMQTASNGAVSSIRHIASTIMRINGISAAIAAAVDEQGAATAEIARNVREAAKGTVEASRNISQVQSVADQTKQSAQEVLSAAKLMSNESLRLSEHVDLFLRQVRCG